MLDKINNLFSEPYNQSDVVDREPLRPDELQALIHKAGECGYSLKDAIKMAAPYGVVSSELYAAWYSIEHGIPIFIDNIQHLVHLTGWNRSPPAEPGLGFDLGVCPQRAMSGG